MSSPPPMYKLAIVGAGPAGCTLARILLHTQAPVSITIFEGEKSYDARAQGGSLDLHPSSGLEALKRAGLYDRFNSLARFDGEAIKVANQDFKCFINMPGTKDAASSRGRPEIDRVQLRQILLDSLPADIIRWDHHLLSVTPMPASWQLNFRGRAPVSGFDLVVGADGAWSHCRAVLSGVKPVYAGITGITATISAPEARAPEVYGIVNRGSMFSYGRGRAIMGQQLGSGEINMATWIATPEENAQKLFGSALAAKDYDGVKKTLLGEFDGWSPTLRNFIEAADGEPQLRNLYMLPVGHRWEHKKGVTVLGDAAHLMTPFIGEGVNLAMTDAFKLAEGISAACEARGAEVLDQKVAAFETDMFERATDFQARTYEAMRLNLLEPGGPDANIEKILINMGQDEVPWWGMGIFKAAVYTYFWGWRKRNGVKATA